MKWVWLKIKTKRPLAWAMRHQNLSITMTVTCNLKARRKADKREKVSCPRNKISKNTLKDTKEAIRNPRKAKIKAECRVSAR